MNALSFLFLACGVLIDVQPARTLLRSSSEWSTKRIRDGPLSAVDIAADIDLFAACLASGATTLGAAEVLASSAAPATRDQWRNVAALLSLGVRAKVAWEPMAEIPELNELSRLAQASEKSGRGLADASKSIAGRTRQAAIDASIARAERAGVLIALPLAVCFLPAFFVLGLAPIVINLATTMMN